MQRPLLLALATPLVMTGCHLDWNDRTERDAATNLDSAPLGYADDGQTEEDAQLEGDAISPVTVSSDASLPADAGPPQFDGPYVQNATFMARLYVAAAEWQGAFLAEQLAFLSARGVRVLAVNVGDVMPDGNLSNGCNAEANGSCRAWSGFTTCSAGYAAGFLNAIRAFEEAHPEVHFELYAWLNNGRMRDPASRVQLDRLWNADKTAEVDNPVQTTLANQALRFVVPTGDCATESRQFDGVLYDFEPSGITADPFPLHGGTVSNMFEGLKHTMIKTRKLFDPHGRKVAALALSWRETPGVWGWTSGQFYFLGQHVDALFVSTYDSGSTSASSYGAWLSSQVDHVIDAVSGVSNGLPEPARKPRVYIGLPAFGPSTAAHLTQAESITNSLENPAVTLREHTVDRCARDTKFCSYFAGASLYLQRSGHVCNPDEQGAAACAARNSAGLYDDARGRYYASQEDWNGWVRYWLDGE